MPSSTVYIPIDQVIQTLQQVLQATGLPAQQAQLCAQLFAAASRDGTASHGLDRFPGFIKSIQKGYVDIHAQPKLLLQAGPLERWDGQLGPGPLNAHFAMDRAINLARQHSIGCVGLCRTNHWMRAGNYGWQAADAAMIAICWTNTTALMPPWGSAQNKVGNNPLVLAVPRPQGHLVLDMAMSQFSFGKLAALRRLGQQTPVPGGFDAQGNPTMDPAAILKGGHMLPIGYWKGVGLAVMLDVIAAALAGGNTTAQITAAGGEHAVSQVFLAIDTAPLGGPEQVARIAHDVVADLCAADPLDTARPVLYPGQRAMHSRQQSLAKGVPVDSEVWATIEQLHQTVKP